MNRIEKITGVTMLWLVLLFPAQIFAGSYPISNGKTAVVIREAGSAGLVLNSTVSGFNYTEVQTPSGLFTLLNIDGYGQQNVVGEPALPVFHKLVEVPLEAGFTVRVVRSHFTEIDLPASGIIYPLIPAQPSVSKSDDPAKLPFIWHKEYYQNNDFTAGELVTITRVGILRALVLARIDLAPVQYNPATKKLRIYDELEVEIAWEHPNNAATLQLKTQKASPYFKSLYNMVENYKPLPFSDELITASPVTYVIVSDPMFQSALQPFIEWKKKKGFRVIEGYTNNPVVGVTTTSIKSWLQGLYNTPPAGYNVPSFILFVGDVAQIPAWAGTAGSHVTDLRYCEYTGDNFPEVYYGRFSATTVEQLQPQIDKTLEYEKYLMPDPSFLGKAVMAAGADASFQTHSNGQINYGTETYFNAAHGILSHIYLQPEPSGANYSQNIKNNVSAGVSYANYTAHCSSGGWADPSFVIADIPNLTNTGKYCLMVGNCCLSCKFDVSSFAEEQLRAANKGSVGYIGGSNNTYWDEDYWWGCGFKTVVLHPAYDAAHIGAYDGTFHDHGESTADWFITQGQMTICGNYAVEESTSSLKTYYWEIYHLMGDPSLMIYFSVPPALTASYTSPLMIGMTSLAVTTEPYAYAALSMNGTLLDARIADGTGAVTLTFNALSSPGSAGLVITKQNRQPFQGTIQVIPASGPYVMYESGTISDPAPGGNNNGQMDFSEINQFNVTLKNVGVQTAADVNATLATTSSYITVTDNTENFGTIGPNQMITKNGAFAWTVAGNIPDQTSVPFTLLAASGSNNWSSQFNITANAPSMQIGAMTVQDNCSGCNNNGILDAGETANLIIGISNTGHAGAVNVSSALAITGGSGAYLTLNNTTASVGSVAANGTANAVFSVTANSASPVGTPVDLSCSVTAGLYSANAPKQVVIGLIPTYIMSTNTISTCTGNFYDPGGATAPYTDNLNYTMTINPATAGNMLKVVFTAFELESQSACSYDYLKIYDGNSTAATLLGTWCGTTSPGTIIANNPTGSLTFVFRSDVSITLSGWAASLSCIGGMVINPAGFTASSASPVQIDLAWTPNAAAHPVMVAFSMNNVFGTPVSGTAYTSGSSLAGGGTVIGTISGNSLNHTGLSPNTTYFYKAFSCDPTYNYSAGTTASANTGCSTVDAFPYIQDFESGGTLPNCWTQEYVTLPGLNWIFVKGNGSSSPSTAHSGNYNACLKDQSAGDNKTKLISPKLNLAVLPQPRLKFWHTQAFWSPDQDLLSVWYKSGTSGAWTLLASYTGSITAWTQETIALPNSSENYYIAFEGNAKYGYGVCVDDVEISSSCASTFPVAVAVTSSANPVCSGVPVTFSSTVTNGGTTPAYQWLVNGTAVSGATGSTYIFSPQHNDQVVCRVSSNLVCASGNPALSQAVTMTVDPMVQVGVTISADENPVYSGNVVNITAIPVNGGTSPAFQWMVNGNVAGNNNPVLSYIPQDGDVVTCTLTSDATCPIMNPVVSDQLIISVLSVPAVIFLNDITVTGNRCYDATQTITVAGDDHLFVVEAGGVVTMIAGQQISYLPGTTIKPGGYLHGYIAPGGPFCIVPAMMATSTGQGALVTGSGEASCQVVPNPTFGLFRMICKGCKEDQQAEIQVYDQRGVRIISATISSDEQNISLEGYAPGIYLVRISQGETTGTVRVVKL